MMKKLLSVLLALTMVLSFMPTSAFADDGESEETFYLDNGSITIEAKSDGKQYVTQVNGVTDEKQTGKIVITQSSTAATTNTITIKAAESRTAYVTLSGVNIVTENNLSAPPVTVKGAGDTVITLVGENYVKSAGEAAGIQKESTGKLTISATDTNQSLTATSSGSSGAGIGGTTHRDGSNITISGGTINATGGLWAAGIGGGLGGAGNNITISGGKVTATGGLWAAGIGSGGWDTVPGYKGSNITISGGEVTATGGDFGAGIGGGFYGDGSNIIISGGKVTATGGASGTGIGGGGEGSGSNITVSGTAQLRTQGGNKSGWFGTGAPIGNGGNSTTDGAEVTPDTDELTLCGKIEYYAQGVDMETTTPTKTITGTVGSHNWDGGTVTKQPTCTEAGEKNFSCSRCGVTKTETVNKLPHTLEKHDAKAATCTETGNVEYWHCSVCGKNFTSEASDTEITDLETEKNAKNHSGTAVWTQTATTHEKKWNCCNAVVVANEPHEWENGKCSECGYACLHSGGTATCTEKAVCEICSQKYGDLAPHELTHIAAKAATTAEFGNTEYWHCDVCDKYFSDENSTNEIALADTVISKLAPKIIAGDGATVTQGEKKALSFTSDAAFDDFLRVEVDGKTVNESSYTVKSGSTVVTLNADYVATLSVGEHTLGIVSESGTATAKFTVNKKAAETTGKTDKPTTDDNKTSPQTGDGSNLALWFALLFISGGTVIGTTVISRKKKYNK